MAVADIFTAISEDRPYRKGMDEAEIHRILQSQADNNFLDKRIVALLFDNYEAIRLKVKEKQAEARIPASHRGKIHPEWVGYRRHFGYT